jgi:EmrB/QacA subfamily drug resistance transporter
MNEETIVDPKRWWALAVILIGMLMAILDAFIVNVAIPSIQASLHMSMAGVQLVVAGYSLAYAVALVTGGRLGDMLGRKRVFQLGMVVFTLSSLACGLSPNAVVLIVARVIQGFGSALMVPQVLSIIQVSFTAEEKPKAFGFYGGVLGLAGVMGQVLGGVLISSNFLGLDWRNVFLVNVPIGIIAMIAGIPLIRNSRASGVHKLDLIGVGLLSLALFCLVYPLTQGQTDGWPLWTVITPIVSLFFFAMFVRYEQYVINKGGDPLLFIELFRKLRFSLGLITVLAFFCGNGGFFFVLALFLQDGHGLSPLMSGLTFAPMGIGYLLSSLFSANLIRRMGLRLLLVAPILMIIGYIGTLIVVQHSSTALNSAPLVPLFFLLGLGQGLISTSLLNVVLVGIKPQHAGAASGTFMTTVQVSLALGVAFMGIIFFSALGLVGHLADQLSIQYGNAFSVTLAALTGLAVVTLIFLAVLIRLPQSDADADAGDMQISAELAEELELESRFGGIG